ncbi:hypothetical protein FE251_10240 [Georgenia wutianyii]|uniref:Cell wall-binding repeat-containing protein n=1 Tax=Georgenia wutianyii TaxID=2585135 RepID=A0ABX5VML2_9MICO|nr:hypothetical protein [Georgenia wutianyii]QDB79712.1 hypothetical protein FE251_10240 [Georgenia wutianyii]
MTRRRPRALVLTGALCLALTACAADVPAEQASPAASPSPTPEPGPEQGTVRTSEAAATVLPTGGLALAASQTFFDRAPVVVLADDADPASQLRASSVALAVGAPVLLDDDGAALATELDRLDADWVLTVGDATLEARPGDETTPEATPDAEDATGDVVVVPAPADDAALADLLGTTATEPLPAEAGREVAALAGVERGSFTPLQAPVAETAPSDPATAPATAAPTTEPETQTAELPRLELPEALPSTLALTTGDATELLAAATARAAGAHLAVVPGGDPRATSETVAAVSGAGAEHVVGLGDAFGDAETLGWRAATAATGVELPGGGQLVFPGKRYVALYGSPVTPALGVLGEQGTPETVARAAEHAAAYDGLTEDTVVPAMEIIATVASAGPGTDGNYSTEWPAEDLRPLVEAAGEAGQYVVLDLQPGRASFLEQAQQYADLLALPHVGLALDPEWNLGPDEVHMVRIGSVSAAEVNEVVDWLADFTRERNLPQKLLVLHQFQVRMIQTVPEVDRSRSELAVLVHADGQGGQGAKQSTWRTLHEHAPDIEWWGWKNFYDEDSPMLTPEQTMSQVDPVPHFISYQ